MLISLFRSGTEPVEKFIRPNAGEKEKKVSVMISSDDSSYTYEGVVNPCIYSAGELDSYMQEVRDYIDSHLFYEGESADCVITGLRLVEKVPDNPVKIKWDIERNEFIDKKGMVRTEKIDGDTLTVVRAVLSCQKYVCEYEIPVKIRVSEKSDTELFWENVNGKMDELLATETDEKEIMLPREIDGHPVRYEKKRSNSLLLFGLLLGALPLIYLAGKREEEKNIEKNRLNKLTGEYSDFVGKFVILLGAGMNAYNVFIRLSDNYERKIASGGKKNELYEEVRITAGELRSGVYEKNAYDSFGRRTGILSYIRFSSILSQNLRDGSAGLLKRLEDEQMNALKDRKAYATEMGERLETKILLPMVLELIIILMMIMVPAFLSI